MPFSQVLQTVRAFAAGIAPAVKAPRPLEIDFELPDAPDPFERVAIGIWATDDGAIRLSLRHDGRYHKAKGGQASAHRGRYAVDRSKLYFEDDSGHVALGEMRRGVLSIGEKRFRKAPEVSAT